MKSQRPPDRYHATFAIFLLLGIGTLIPWNVFINAMAYFVDYKLDTPQSYNASYRTHFLSYVSYAAQIPNLGLAGINTFYQGQQTLSELVRYNILLLPQIGIMASSIVFCVVDTANVPFLFFCVTLLSVGVINAVGGAFQNLVFSMASRLPSKYTNVVIIGSNASGTIISFFNILVKALPKIPIQIATLLYFSLAEMVILACYFSYPILNRLEFYKHHINENAAAEKVNIKKYPKVFKKCWVHCLNTYLVFLCTLSVFPVIQASVQPNTSSFFINESWFTEITCFLFFNLFALAGNLVAFFIKWPKPNYLLVCTSTRLVLTVLFFLGSNYNTHNRILPVLITNDYAYLVGSILFAFTSGYFSSVAMHYAIVSVGPVYVKSAALLASFTLICGVFSGINVSTLLTN